MNGEASQALAQQLGVFQHARNWKRTLSRHILPHLRGDVLEVGAGFGAATQWLCPPSARSWRCLEPDEAIYAVLRERHGAGMLPDRCTPALGTLGDLDPGQTFDAIVYVDVLEHIPDDKGEVLRAASRLRRGGCLVVLSPAHQFLFSPFDQSIGHVRRYSKEALTGIMPAGLSTVTCHYLDSVGLLASLANRLLLRQSAPDLKQILFWDRVLVRLSNLVDPLIGYRAGKSVLYVGLRE